MSIIAELESTQNEVYERADVFRHQLRDAQAYLDVIKDLAIQFEDMHVEGENREIDPSEYVFDMVRNAGYDMDAYEVFELLDDVSERDDGLWYFDHSTFDNFVRQSEDGYRNASRLFDKAAELLEEQLDELDTGITDVLDW